MKLKSFNYFIGLLIIFSYSHLLSEEKIDIWKNKKETITNSSKLENSDTQKRSNLQTSQTIKALEKIQVQEGLTTQLDDQKVYGIYEPSNYDFNLNMWSTTKAEDLRSSLKRLNKIELSTKQLKDFPEWQFLPHNDLERKTIAIYFDLKIAKRSCHKEHKVIKVPNTNVFKIVAPILISRGISRIVTEEKLISL